MDNNYPQISLDDMENVESGDVLADFSHTS